MMNQLALWGPTLVTVIGWIFFAGVMWQKQTNQERRSDEHEDQLQDQQKQLNNQAVDISRLQAWKDGYAAARALYDHRAAPVAGD